MQREELTAREKEVARRNAILFCGAATVVMTVILVVSIVFVYGAM